MLDHRVNKINLSESLSLRDFKSREKAVVVVVVIVFVVVVVVVVVNFGSKRPPQGTNRPREPEPLLASPAQSQERPKEPKPPTLEPK